MQTSIENSPQLIFFKLHQFEYNSTIVCITGKPYEALIYNTRSSLSPTLLTLRYTTMACLQKAFCMRDWFVNQAFTEVSYYPRLSFSKAGISWRMAWKRQMLKACLIIGNLFGTKWQGYCEFFSHQYIPNVSNRCRALFKSRHKRTISTIVDNFILIFCHLV